jgi:hypothetical protein
MASRYTTGTRPRGAPAGSGATAPPLAAGDKAGEARARAARAASRDACLAPGCRPRARSPPPLCPGAPGTPRRCPMVLSCLEGFMNAHSGSSRSVVFAVCRFVRTSSLAGMVPGSGQAIKTARMAAARPNATPGAKEGSEGLAGPILICTISLVWICKVWGVRRGVVRRVCCSADFFARPSPSPRVTCATASANTLPPRDVRRCLSQQYAPPRAGAPTGRNAVPPPPRPPFTRPPVPPEPDAPAPQYTWANTRTPASSTGPVTSKAAAADTTQINTTLTSARAPACARAPPPRAPVIRADLNTRRLHNLQTGDLTKHTTGQKHTHLPAIGHACGPSVTCGPARATRATCCNMPPVTARRLCPAK